MKTKFLHLCCAAIGLMLILAACVRNGSSQTKTIPTLTPQPLASGVQQVDGVVLSGGDTSPQGRLDAPRSFVYRVKLDGGAEIEVAYTAYPPSPAGDARPKVQLTFHAGEILVGDYLSARGIYDPATNTLTVAVEGDFIQTFEKKQ